MTAIDLSAQVEALAIALGYDKGTVKRITLEPNRATVLAFDLTPSGSKYIQIPPGGSSDLAALYERTHEITT